MMCKAATMQTISKSFPYLQIFLFFVTNNICGELICKVLCAMALTNYLFDAVVCVYTEQRLIRFIKR